MPKVESIDIAIYPKSDKQGTAMSPRAWGRGVGVDEPHLPDSPRTDIAHLLEPPGQFTLDQETKGMNLFAWGTWISVCIR